jgi:predicted small lipoprotein YifL
MSECRCRAAALLLVAVVAASLLPACGKKGPLYLPDAPPGAAAPGSTPAGPQNGTLSGQTPP